ncbi:unnamed protein product [Microthlaspi erraticum]|uniref:Xylanase inhibitor C-terminal domain-containing protein n=1 Tax=Microthlaspi erraticum TaxID=1685480 RepID=A0A6D2IZB9_9BRAS|nr:unnamed protein product [Microthlaspi erraticum]CAA7045638.1 unnamed protein product [Microthlaspi erraticum]
MNRASLLLLLLTISLCKFFDLSLAKTPDELNLAAESPMIIPLSYSSLTRRVEDFCRRRLQQSQLLDDGRTTSGIPFDCRYWKHWHLHTLCVEDDLKELSYDKVLEKKYGRDQFFIIDEDPKFQPELSSSCEALKCNSDCNCDDDGKLCVYERRYAEMSTSSGLLSENLISFGQHAVFGCENAETWDLFSQRADGFSLCYGGMEVGGGAMVVGKITPPAGMVFARSDSFRSPYYNIHLKQMHVAGKSLKLNPKVFNEKHGTVLDSGTTYAYFPKQVFIAIKDAVIKETPSLKRIHGPDTNYDNICFSGAGSFV